MNKLALAAVLLAAPLAARADIGLRLGADADIAYNHNDGSGTHAITSNWPLGADVMLSWWLPTNLLSLDAEVAEQFLLSPPTGVSNRLGTILRPGVRLSPPVLPIYLRGAIPISIPNCPSGATCPTTFGLRLGAGITIPLILFKVYIEGDADFPLAGGTGAPSAFSSWDLILNGGLDFRF